MDTIQLQEANQMIDEVWETVEKAAPFLKMSSQALYTAVRDNQLPPQAVLRIGRRIRINLRALQSMTAGPVI